MYLKLKKFQKNIYLPVGGVEPRNKFSKRMGLDRTSTFTGGKRGVTFFGGGCNCHIENKLKPEIFNDKKSL